MKYCDYVGMVSAQTQYKILKLFCYLLKKFIIVIMDECKIIIKNTDSCYPYLTDICNYDDEYIITKFDIPDNEEFCSRYVSKFIIYTNYNNIYTLWYDDTGKKNKLTKYGKTIKLTKEIILLIQQLWKRIIDSMRSNKIPAGNMNLIDYTYLINDFTNTIYKIQFCALGELKIIEKYYERLEKLNEKNKELKKKIFFIENQNNYLNKKLEYHSNLMKYINIYNKEYNDDKHELNKINHRRTKKHI
jgi:hypothetical protein